MHSEREVILFLRSYYMYLDIAYRHIKVDFLIVMIWLYCQFSLVKCHCVGSVLWQQTLNHVYRYLFEYLPVRKVYMRTSYITLNAIMRKKRSFYGPCVCVHMENVSQS